MNKQEALRECTVFGNVVKLPNIQLERKLYQDVAKSLELIGGKWKGVKISGFVFDQDPTELLNKIAEGDQINLKKEYQFFETPEEIADFMVSLANIYETDLILEPSAGKGAIVKAINKVIGVRRLVFCYEAMDTNRMFLEKIANVNICGNDFLWDNGIYEGVFDKIIANPPFSKNQDIDHIYQMHKKLSDTGLIVTVCSNHPWVSSNSKERQFVEWLEDKLVECHEIEAGSFKSSGTMVGAKILVIQK